MQKVLDYISGWLLGEYSIRQYVRKRKQNKKYKECIRYYRANPDKFVEDYLGVELYDWQKDIIKNEMKRR